MLIDAYRRLGAVEESIEGGLATDGASIIARAVINAAEVLAVEIAALRETVERMATVPDRSVEEEQPRLMEIEAGWASHPSSTVEMVLARVSGSGVSTNMRDEAMADLWPAFQRWVEAYGWPDRPAEEPNEPTEKNAG